MVSKQELIERITREVMEMIENDEITMSLTGGDQSTLKGSKTLTNNTHPRVLVILTDGPVERETVQKKIEELADQELRIELFFDHSFSTADRESFKLLPNVDQFYEAHFPEKGCYKLVTSCDAVVLPTLSLDTLNQISEQDGADASGWIACEALSQGKPLWAPTDTFWKKSSSAIRKKITEKLKKAGEIGLVSTPLHEMPHDFLKRSGKTDELTEITICRSDPDPDLEPEKKVERNDDEIVAVVQTKDARIATSIGVRDVKKEVGGYIDHTLLNPDVTREDIVQLCEEAREHEFASVCINPSWVTLCDELLQDTDVKVCTVIGFPLGATTTSTKVQEAKEAIANGADEVDMVINIGGLKQGNYEYVKKDIEAVKNAAGDRVLKVILETGLLSDRQKTRASRLCKEAGADYVKTSTGFGPGGANMHDIALMRRAVGSDLGVKASGGVHNFEEAVDMISAGANRIGASAGVSIVSGEESDSDY